MSKTWVVVLSIIGGFFLLAVIAVGGIAYWVYQNKDKWIQSVDQAGNDAKKFGAQTDNEGCLKEALSRHKQNKSLTGQISTQIFLSICLQESAPSTGFCDGVPKKDEIMKSISWTLKKCTDSSMQNDEGCKRMFGLIQEYCHRGDRRQEN